jgi:hypothetical protein
MLAKLGSSTTRSRSPRILRELSRSVTVDLSEVISVVSTPFMWLRYSILTPSGVVARVRGRLGAGLLPRGRALAEAVDRVGRVLVEEGGEKVSAGTAEKEMDGMVWKVCCRGGSGGEPSSPSESVDMSRCLFLALVV